MIRTARAGAGHGGTLRRALGEQWEGPASVDVQGKLAEIRQSVEAPRTASRGASVRVNRAELLGALDELAEMIPQALGEADRVVATRDRVLETARQQALQIIADAELRRDELVSESVVFQLARTEAERVQSECRHETSELRRETDDYVDQRLASFELTLSKTLAAVQRGRERLHGRSDLDELGKSAEDLTPLPGHEAD
jgi:cell division septum initiation protein DivIVA